MPFGRGAPGRVGRRQKNYIVSAISSENEAILEEIRLANTRLVEQKPGVTSRVKVVVENIKTRRKLEKIEYISMVEAANALGVHKTTIGSLRRQ